MSSREDGVGQGEARGGHPGVVVADDLEELDEMGPGPLAVGARRPADRVDEPEERVLDVATEQVETPETVAQTIEAALAFVPAEHLYPSTNCGLVPLPRTVARRKLHALAAGAQLARTRLPGG